jgi:hypothetical protein
LLIFRIGSHSFIQKLARVKIPKSISDIRPTNESEAQIVDRIPGNADREQNCRSGPTQG